MSGGTAPVFDALTIDGRTLRAAEIMEHLRRCAAGEPARWPPAFLSWVAELVEGEGPVGVLTSGTTGDPKRILMPRSDLAASARLTARTFGLKAGDRALLCLPCEFIAGRMMVARAMLLGLDLHVIDPAGSVLDNLRTRDRIRFAAMLPLQLQRALHEDRSRVEAQFEEILLGGGPLGEGLLDDMQGLRVRVHHGYGSTETLTHVALRPLTRPGADPVFTALGEVRFTSDEEGRLIIRTPHLSVTRHATNDVVELMDDTHFRWLGRRDHVILTGGSKVFPEKLEMRTSQVVHRPHYFIGEPDALLGQRIVLVLEGAELTESEREGLEQMLAFVLTKHERPKRIVTLRSFVRTRSGKIVRSLPA